MAGLGIATDSVVKSAVKRGREEKDDPGPSPFGGPPEVAETSISESPNICLCALRLLLPESAP